MAVPYVSQLHREAGLAPTRPPQVRRVDQVAHEESPALVVRADVGILRRPPCCFLGRAPGSTAHPAHRRKQRLHEQDSAIATPPANSEPRINDRIRAREVRLVGHDGQQIGIKPLPEALALARELDLDLVEVAAQANPPVCRVMDYGKFKYEEAQKAKESRRKTSNVVIKEMKYRPKIGGGDFDTKTRKVEHFLAEGHKVKVTLTFRGREVYHPELGKKILDQVEEAAPT
jgi:translation initiation factor IF-3